MSSQQQLCQSFFAKFFYQVIRICFQTCFQVKLGIHGFATGIQSIMGQVKQVCEVFRFFALASSNRRLPFLQWSGLFIDKLSVFLHLGVRDIDLVKQAKVCRVINGCR